MSFYGWHRVIEPHGVIPQAAKKVNNEPRLLDPYEVLIEVQLLNLDSTSMKSIRERAAAGEGTEAELILSIINSRGKMHNPVTDSGGVLVGVVKEIGEALKDTFRLAVDAPIVPLCSLTAIPLYISEIKQIHGDQVSVLGNAIIFGKYSYASIPDDFSMELSLAAIDVSRLLPQVERYTKPGHTVLVVGCGKAGLTAVSAVRRCAPSARILAVDVTEKQLDYARRLGKADVVDKVSATDAKQMWEFATKNTPNGEGADLVLSCVNVPNGEAGCVISTKQGGTVIFFSMATNFSRACLSTDGTSKDINLLIGGGVFPDAADRMYDLLRQDHELRTIFSELH